MSEQTGLKSCPFCGADAYMSSEHDADDIAWHFIKCRKCGARSQGKWHSPGNDCPQLRVEVRDEWNCRAAPPVVPEKHSSLPEAAKLAWRALCDAEAVINTIDGDDCLETVNLEELRERIRDVATHLFVILRLPVSELSAPAEPVQRPGDHLPSGSQA